jgi:hypothetical protein
MQILKWVGGIAAVFVMLRLFWVYGSEYVIGSAMVLMFVLWLGGLIFGRRA